MSKQEITLTDIRKKIIKKLGIHESTLSNKIAKIMRSLPISIPREYATYIFARENGVLLKISEDKREKLNEYLKQIGELKPKTTPQKAISVTDSSKTKKKSTDNSKKAITINLSNFNIKKTNLSTSRVKEAKDTTELYFYLNLFENSIRFFVHDIMKRNHGDSWWTAKVTQQTQNYVIKVKAKKSKGWLWKEEPHELFYTTFGQLIEIIEQNWIDFKTVFGRIDKLKWFINPIKDIRNPIAHNNSISKTERNLLLQHIQQWFDFLNTIIP